MTKLTILRGLSGSGKSTLAATLGGIVVSRDAIRLMLFGAYDARYFAVGNDDEKAALAQKEEAVTVAQDALISAYLKAGSDVIVDNTNVQWKFVKEIAKIGYRYGAKVEIRLVDVPLDIAIQRDQHRGATGGRYVGDAVIRRQHLSLERTRNFELPEATFFEPYIPVLGMPSAYIVDIDGTVAHHNNKRSPYAWDKIGMDTPDHSVIMTIKSLEREGHQIIFTSGRDESCREATFQWLETHIMPRSNFKLFMRPEKDVRADNIVKLELFDKHIRDNYVVVGVFDDRQQVVDAWRSIGLKCFQVQEGNF